ncbi:hypothetical protein NX783_16095 [Massilia kyonggiensis]|nr:hypothetical protein [Massilia kyonggiensis]
MTIMTMFAQNAANIWSEWNPGIGRTRAIAFLMLFFLTWRTGSRIISSIKRRRREAGRGVQPQRRARQTKK